MKAMNDKVNVGMVTDSGDTGVVNNGLKLTKMMTLPLRALQTTHFQRDIEHKNTNAIKKEFDTCMLDPIKVSYRNGKYHIIDGQHRYIVLCEMFGMDTMVNVVVLYDLTYEKEAEYFARQNENKRLLTHANVLKAKIVYDTTARDMVSVCKDAGFILSTGAGKARNKINAVATFTKIYNTLRPSKTYDMLSLIYSCWDGDNEATSSTFLSGMADFYKLYGDKINTKRFVKVFSNIRAMTITQAAKSNVSRAYSKDRKVTMELVALYNKGLKNKLPEPNFV